LLQICGLTDEPRGLRVRYRLLNQIAGSANDRNLSRESLTERLDAAGEIRNSTERSRAFARLAADAAKAGAVDLVEAALQGVSDNATRDQAALDSARLLARRHLRRQAIEIAKGITATYMRDQALSELAQ